MNVRLIVPSVAASAAMLLLLSGCNPLGRGVETPVDPTAVGYDVCRETVTPLLAQPDRADWPDVGDYESTDHSGGFVLDVAVEGEDAMGSAIAMTVICQVDRVGDSDTWEVQSYEVTPEAALAAS